MYNVHRGQGRVSPQTGLTDACESPPVICNPNLGPLRGQPVLLTPEPPLQYLSLISTVRSPPCLQWSWLNWRLQTVPWSSSVAGKAETPSLFESGWKGDLHLTSGDLSVLRLPASSCFCFHYRVELHLKFITATFKRTSHCLVLVMRKGNELSKNVQNHPGCSEDLPLICLADSQYSLQRPASPDLSYLRTEDAWGRIYK